MAEKPPLTFEISLSVLNHLGRNLYRSFATVLGEAISNAWDADAKNVRIYIDREKGSLVICDDGHGMTADDIQNKFLRIGYSKRKDGIRQTVSGRPFVGRKGIGKLALLSCAKRITIVSKTKTGELVGGVIDNDALDKAITDDLKPQQYRLEDPDGKMLKRYTRDLKKGTVLYFDGIKGGMRNSVDHLRKIIALYFRFSLVDRSFKVFLNDKKVTHQDLHQLANQTEFLWKIGETDDPFVEHLEKIFAHIADGHETAALSLAEVGFT